MSFYNSGLQFSVGSHKIVAEIKARDEIAPAAFDGSRNRSSQTIRQVVNKPTVYADYLFVVVDQLTDGAGGAEGGSVQADLSLFILPTHKLASLQV